MEIDEHLKYTLYVKFIFTPDTGFTTNTPSQLAIRPLPQSRRAHGLPQNTRLLLVISAKAAAAAHPVRQQPSQKPLRERKEGLSWGIKGIEDFLQTRATLNLSIPKHALCNERKERNHLISRKETFSFFFILAHDYY
jgi:hypothetical protein